MNPYEILHKFGTLLNTKIGTAIQVTHQDPHHQM